MTTEEVTPEVEEQEKPAVEEKEEFAPVDHRQEMLAQVEASRKADLESEGVIIEDEPDPEEDDEPAGEEGEEALESSGEEEEEEVDESDLVSLKINGATVKVTRDQLVEMAQKGASAELKHQELAAERKRLEALGAKLNGEDGSDLSPSKKDEAKVKDLSERERAIAEKFYSGDQDLVVEAIRETQELAVEKATAARHAEARAAKGEVLSTQLATGFERFQKEFPDIEEDSPEWALADSFTKQVFKEAQEGKGQYKDMGDILIEGGKRAMAYLGKTENNDPLKKGEKLDAKRRASKANLPSLGKRTQTKKVKDDTPVLPSEAARSSAIADIAAAREGKR